MEPKSISFRGWAPLYGAERAKISEMLRSAGATPLTVQEFNNKLAAQRVEGDKKFKDSFYENPQWKARLRRHVTGSKEWIDEVNKIAKQVKVRVTYIPRSPGHGALEVQIGTGLPLFNIQV